MLTIVDRSLSQKGSVVPQSSRLRRRETRIYAARVRYQACEPPQCGQPTEVETAAWKMKPHPHEYIA
jgi:hypothetical protein